MYKRWTLYIAFLIEVVCGRGDYDHIMNNLTKAENDSSSGPENTMHQSKWQQNSNSMQLNASTSNKSQLHQKLLGRGGDSQRDFVSQLAMGCVTCHACH